jgi:hypothetical protein
VYLHVFPPIIIGMVIQTMPIITEQSKRKKN